MITWILTAGVAAAVAVLLVSERRRWAQGQWISKTTASLLFLAVAVAQGALERPMGIVVLVALGLSLIGDVLLLLRDRKAVFLAGLGVFLLAHLVFSLAFFQLRATMQSVLVASAALLVPAVAAGVWLWPHVAPKMRVPVAAYILAITWMLATALAAGWGGQTWLIPAGAFLFYASDLAVARQRFIQASFWNRAWGLPAYYTGQVMLAWSVATFQAPI